MDINFVYTKNVNIVERFVGKELILLPVHAQNHEAVYSLNETGAFVWTILDGKHDVQTIVSNIIDKFKIVSTRKENVTTDVKELLDDLASAGLIVPV